MNLLSKVTIFKLNFPFQLFIQQLRIIMPKTYLESLPVADEL